jgi:hypothetical protein
MARVTEARAQARPLHRDSASRVGDARHDLHHGDM